MFDVLDVSEVCSRSVFLFYVIQRLATGLTVRGSNPEGAKFSVPVQTGSDAHPASYTIGTGSFSGVKRPGRGVDYPLPSSTEVKDGIELYLYSTSGPSWPVLVCTCD